MTVAALSERQKLPDLIATATARDPGTEIVVSEDPRLLPHVLEARLLDTRRLSEDIVLLSLTMTSSAHVSRCERVRHERLPVDGVRCRFHCVSIEYGFADDLDVPAALSDAWNRGALAFDPRAASYACGEEDVHIDRRAQGFMSYWRKLLFRTMARRASALSEHLQLPPARTRTYRIPVSL
jgi:K+ transporter